MIFINLAADQAQHRFDEKPAIVGNHLLPDSGARVTLQLIDRASQVPLLWSLSGLTVIKQFGRCAKVYERMKRVLTILLAGYLMLNANSSAAESSAQLRVSATVPPKACQYPDTCKPVPATIKTSVTVSNEVVRYIGSPPAIAEKDGLLTITF